MYILFPAPHEVFLIKTYLQEIGSKVNIFPQHSGSEVDYFHSSFDISFGGSQITILIKLPTWERENQQNE